MRFSEAATRVVLQKKVFLEILQNSQENTCARVSFFSKVAGLGRLWHRCFPVNFAKFLRTPFLQNTTGRLLIDFTVKPVYSGHRRFLEKVSAITTCTLHRVLEFFVQKRIAEIMMEDFFTKYE